MCSMCSCSPKRYIWSPYLEERKNSSSLGEEFLTVEFQKRHRQFRIHAEKDMKAKFLFPWDAVKAKKKLISKWLILKKSSKRHLSRTWDRRKSKGKWTEYFKRYCWRHWFVIELQNGASARLKLMEFQKKLESKTCPSHSLYSLLFQSHWKMNGVEWNCNSKMEIPECRPVHALNHAAHIWYYCTLTFNDNLTIYGMVFHSNLSSSNKNYCDREPL